MCEEKKTLSKKTDEWRTVILINRNRSAFGRNSKLDFLVC